MGELDKVNYVIISPVRNEEKYIEETLASVICQTVRPDEWVIVNDGSTDNTESIIKKNAKDQSWIKIVNKKDRGFTEVGGGVIESFQEGLKNVKNGNWDFIVKLDGDILVDKNFFERLLKRFEEDEALGITGGTCYVSENKILREEKMPEFHPSAAARIYRRKCFQDIGGLSETLGWDTIDLIRAQMKGWATRRFSDLRIVHFRRMASRDGLWEGKLRTGRNFYITGYHPIFLIARSIYRLKEKPYFIESLGVIFGYIAAALKNEPLVVTSEEKKFLQNQQLKRIITLYRKERLQKNIASTHRINICNINIDNTVIEEVLKKIDELIHNGKTSYVVTPNVDHIIKLQKDKYFEEIYKNADLILTDGMPIIWAAKFLGTPLKEKISGSDLFPKLCEVAAEKGYKLFFLGGRPCAAQKSAEVFRAKYPSIQIVGTYCSPFGFESDKEENNKIIKMIKDVKPDILFVGLGAPKQEKWIYEHKDEYQTSVSIGVGASFEFSSEMIKRAPRWMQKIGFEWFWRIIMEPGRLWKRYLIDDMEFFWLVLKQKLGIKCR